MKLTERQKASVLTLTDLIHVVITGDTSHDPQGSSYKAEISQIIDLFPAPLVLNTFVTGGTHNDGTATFTNNEGVGFDVTGFVKSGGENYSNSIGTTATIGGISAGSTFNNQTMTQMWDALLYPYQTPAFSSFARGNLLTDYDLGRPVLNGSQTFTWGTSNSVNVQANTIKIDQLFPSTVNILTGSVNDSTETINLTGEIISATSPTTIPMYKITATNSKSIDFTTTISRTWKHRWYYGKNINTSLTNAQIIDLANSNLITAAINISLTFPSSVLPEYLYIIIPQGLGQPSDWRDSTTGCFGNNIPYSNIGSTSITNVYGVATTYNIYRSTNQITGSQYVWLCS